MLKRLRAARHATSCITPLQPRDDDHNDLWLRDELDQWDQRDQRDQDRKLQRPLENVKAFDVRRPKASTAPASKASRAKAATAATAATAPGRSRAEVDALIRAEAADAEFKAQELLERFAVKMEGDARQWLQLAKETCIVHS